MSIDNVVGNLDWDACQDCKFYRAVEGGCEWLDKLSGAILEFDFGVDWVECTKFEEKK